MTFFDKISSSADLAKLMAVLVIGFDFSCGPWNAIDGW